MSTEELEIGLLLEAVYQRHGFDFRLYQRSLVRERVLGLMAQRGLASVSLLQDRVLHDDASAAAFLRLFGVPACALFDDPESARQTRAVLGALHATPAPRIWLAECAGAPEAWSLAILLADEQLARHSEIFATVANAELLAEARQASIDSASLDGYQENYRKSGGRANLADYFDIDGKRAVLKPALRARITWAQYNLVTDASFNEFELIICRRALAHFGAPLRQRSLQLFHDSLARFGILGIDGPLADDEALAAHYQLVFPHQGWHKRMN